MSEVRIEAEPESSGFVAEALGRRDPDGDRNRREYARNPYRVVQRIAPYDTAVFPSQGDFYQVLCHDLSRGGFSFFQGNLPDFSRLVVELRSGPRRVYMVARVAHCRQVLLDGAGNVTPVTERSPRVPGSSGPPGVPVTLVGCQFVRAVPLRTAVQA